MSKENEVATEGRPYIDSRWNPVGVALRVLIVKTSFTFCYQDILYTFYLVVGAVGTVEKP